MYFRAVCTHGGSFGFCLPTDRMDLAVDKAAKIVEEYTVFSPEEADARGWSYDWKDWTVVRNPAESQGK